MKAMEGKKSRKIGGMANLEEFSLYDCDIPDYLLTEILIRLPLKSIFCFKTVSRRWLSLISDPFFARYYVNRINNDSLLRSHQQWILLSPYFVKMDIPYQEVIDQYPVGLSIEPCSAFSLSFLSPGTEDMISCDQILASSHGLLLCCMNEYPTYYVCNPLTKQHVILPMLPGLRLQMDAGIICQDDGSSYMVVRIPACKSSSEMLELEIFSSESGRWMVLNFDCHVIGYSRIWKYWWFYSTVSYNGILFWTSDDAVNAYDPCKDIYHCYSMDVPDYERSSTLYRLAICCGRLYCLGGGYSLTLWELTNFEWHLKHPSKCSHDMRSNDPKLHEILQTGDLIYFFALAVHPYDLDTVYVFTAWSPHNLLSYNFRTRMLEVVDSGLVRLPIQTLALPPWPTLIPQPSWL